MHLLWRLAELPLDARVALRAPLRGNPGAIEDLTEQLAVSLSIPVDWFIPTPGAGSAGTIDRDYRMVEGSELVLVYFHPDHVMDPDTGTGRLARIAVDAGKAIEAFEPTPSAIAEVGSLTAGGAR